MVQLISIMWRVVLLPIRLLFGHDLFISYARLDGSRYAGSLTDRLLQSFNVRIDAQEADPGDATSTGLLWSLARSRVLVVVATPAAIASPHVLDEMRRFRRWGGASTQVIVEAADTVRHIPEFKGLPYLLQADLTEHAAPSDDVIRQLTRAVGYWKVSRRQAFATVALAAVIFGVLWIAQDTRVRRRQAIAEAMTTNAFRVTNSIGSTLQMRDAVANVVDAFSTWKDDRDVFPEEVSVALLDAAATAKHRGLPLGLRGSLIRDFDVAPGGHLLVTVGPGYGAQIPAAKYFARLWDIPSGEPLGDLL